MLRRFFKLIMVGLDPTIFLGRDIKDARVEREHDENWWG